MAKKKNKTLASTRKKPESAENKQKQEEKKKKGIKKIIKKYKAPKKQAPKTKAKKEKTVKKQETKVEKRPVEEKVVKKKEKVAKQPRFTEQQKRKMTGLALMITGGVLIIIIVYILLAKLFQPQPLAEILPEEGTVALLEVDINADSGQTKQFYELLKNYPVYQSESVVTMIEAFLQLNYANDLEPWIGRKAGVAIYNQQPIFFVESRNQDMTVKAINANPKQLDDGHTVYTSSTVLPGAFTFVNSYLVYSEDSTIITTYLSNLAGRKVSDGEKYIRVRNNLAQGSLIFGFVDYGRLLSALSEDQVFAAQNGQDLLAMKPFLDVFQSAGVTLFAENNRFTAQTFTSVDNEALGDEAYLTFNEKYQGELLNLADPNPIFLAGGHDLTKEINRLEDIFKSGTKTPALVFDGILEAQKQTYFGSDIDLENDIYPLLTGEYLMTVEGSFEEPQVSVFLKLNDQNRQSPLLDKVIDQFIKTSGIFTPRIQEVTLPDGTVGKEIVASPEKIEKFEGNYNGHKYITLQIGDTGKEINYAIQNDVVVFSTSDSIVKSVLDRLDGTTQDGYSQTKYYEDNIRQVLRSSDEILQIQLGAITEFLKLNDNEALQMYLVPFTNFTVAKNYFTDGISTIYLIEVI